MEKPLLEIFNWTEDGYRPLVLSAGWQVALLNWEPLFDWQHAGEIERHNGTDEVFILWRGKALLFAAREQGFQVEEMHPGAVYNVPRGTWHNLIATRDASWIIVENRDTHLGDTELRQMTAAERDQLAGCLPAWAN
ncbi:MAG TPA: hypothetical protein VF813_03315 [Anaerolineaceae bacterium]